MQEECCKKTSGDNLEKDELFRLLACLQGELEAREMAIEALKAERVNSANVRAKYGVINSDRLSGNVVKDPFHALQRDSLLVSSAADNEAALKPLYDTQLSQLENLISSQRFAQTKMRDQLSMMEKRYVKVCEELEDERRNHERDAAQGDDLLVMLEKERERLKFEVEYEKAQNKKLTRELKRVIVHWKEQNVLCMKQKLAAVSLIKERKRLLLQLTAEKNRVSELESLIESSNENQVKMCPIESEKCNPNVDRNESSAFDPHETCHNKNCEVLRKQLNDEIASRKAQELNFEKLKADYEKLTLDHAQKTSINLQQDDRSCLKSSNNTPFSSDVGASSEVSTTALSHRFKPNPPMRRSSEITIAMSFTTTSVTQASGSLANSTTTSAVTVRSKSPTEDNAVKFISRNSPETSSTSPLSVTLSSNSSPSPPSSSRSSTPSPPPPPPPVQLHYPYPGMQSHLNHSGSRGNGAPPFLPSASNSRPLPNSISHTTSVQSSKSRNLITSHQPNPPYQSQYSSAVQASVASNRPVMIPVQANRGVIVRKPATVNLQHTQFHHHSVHSSSHSESSFSQSQTKPSTVNSQFIQRTSPSANVSSHPSSIGSHHFPTYAPHRTHPVLSNPITSNSRPRNTVQTSQTGINPTSPVVGAGHVCVNGK